MSKTEMQAPAAPTSEQCEAARAAVVTDLTRSDSKAAALLGALSLPMGVLVVAVPSHHLTPATTVLVVLGGIGLVVAALLALQVLRPSLGPGSRGTWVYWARCTREELATDLAADRALGRLQDLAQLTLTKYRLYRAATDVTRVSLVILAAALASALI